MIATDAWRPQLNGVVRTYTRLRDEVRASGSELVFLTPEHFRHVACPGYPEIQLAIPDRARAAEQIEQAAPSHIHIATEGPVGWMARRYCLKRGITFTTSYHTKFPEYAARHFGVPENWTYALITRFHAHSAGVMVATRSLGDDLHKRGFRNLMAWTRGVDASRFRPGNERLFGTDKPVFLYAGRISKEKNIEAFLDADLPGLKVVVGDGPHLPSLRQRYPHAIFTGKKSDEDLARYYASADVFVFPSRTDTFGLVLLEALASGVPVAAYPVTGPIDIIENGKSGVLDQDLAKAAVGALKLDKREARMRALEFTWQKTARMFLENIRAAHERAARPVDRMSAGRSPLAQLP